MWTSTKVSQDLCLKSFRKWLQALASLSCDVNSNCTENPGARACDGEWNFWNGRVATLFCISVVTILWQPRHFKARQIGSKWLHFKVCPTVGMRQRRNFPVNSVIFSECNLGRVLWNSRFRTYPFQTSDFKILKMKMWNIYFVWYAKFESWKHVFYQNKFSNHRYEVLFKYLTDFVAEEKRF